MADIKIKQRENDKKTIKTLDKKALYNKKFKDNMVNLKDKTKKETEEKEDNNPIQYGTNKIEKNINTSIDKGINQFNRHGKKSVKETKRNIQNIRQKVKNNTIKTANKTIKGTTKHTKKVIKTVKKTEKVVYKTAKQTEKVTRKSAKKAYQIAKATIKATVHGIKATAKAVKATATATKTVISAILAGGWIVGIIILIVCIIGIACAMLLEYDNGTSNRIVVVALGEVGNVGGEKFWSWYGFDSHVEWCAIFVSWCANECGYIENEIIPKFSSCKYEGVPYFKENNLWQERGYIAKSGDIIFFDWEQDGLADHVGIVEKTENDTVYTIEGNSSGDTCRQKEYNINSNVIYGYGTPLYLTNETVEKRY